MLELRFGIYSLWLHRSSPCLTHVCHWEEFENFRIDPTGIVQFQGVSP